MAKNLTPKQKRFCEEYLIDLNATQAYFRAGYKGKGSTATTNANRMLTNADIEEYIQELRAAQQERTEITADRVIQEVAYIAFARKSNIATVKNSVVEIKDSDQWDEAEKAGVDSIKIRQIISEDREVFDTDVKMHNKTKALELLMKHMGLLSDLNIAGATAEKYGYKLVPIEADDNE
ncbi:MAG: terminase small subunit [Cyanobacteria bacterium P01_F01_bin.150]